MRAALAFVVLSSALAAHAAGGIGDAYRLLNSGKPKEALALFEAAAAAKPKSLEAQEGLAWTFLKLGDTVAAAKAADRRLTLKPNDPVWRRKWLEIISSVPARRVEAILGYRQLLREEIASTVAAPGEAEEELRHLIAVLARPGGGGME